MVGPGKRMPSVLAAASSGRTRAVLRAGGAERPQRRAGLENRGPVA